MGVGLDRADRLIRSDLQGGEGDGYLTDVFLTVMYNIEEALLLAGATPKEDYDVMKLMELAQPYVLARNEAEMLICMSPFV